MQHRIRPSVSTWFIPNLLILSQVVDHLVDVTEEPTMTTQRQYNFDDDILDGLRGLFENFPPSGALEKLGKASAHVLRHEHAEIMQALWEKDLNPKWDAAKKLGQLTKKAGKGIGSYFNSIVSKAKGESVESAAEELAEDLSDAAKVAGQFAMDKIKGLPAFAASLRNSTVHFADQVVQDYQSLETEKERGEYLLKLALYATIFAASAYFGQQSSSTSIAHSAAQSSRGIFLQTAMPVLTFNIVITILLRVLEQSDEQLQEDLDALALSTDIQKYLKCALYGFETGTALPFVTQRVHLKESAISFKDLLSDLTLNISNRSFVDELAYTALINLLEGIGLDNRHV